MINLTIPTHQTVHLFGFNLKIVLIRKCMVRSASVERTANQPTQNQAQQLAILTAYTTPLICLRFIVSTITAIDKGP